MKLSHVLDFEPLCKTLIDFRNPLITLSGQHNVMSPPVCLTNTKKFDHISPVLRELRWPSIKNQLLVRDATMLYKIVNGLAPPYLKCYVNKDQLYTAATIDLGTT